MKDRPILFNGEMVRAILDGRKCQTRRVIKPQPVGVIGQVKLHGAVNYLFDSVKQLFKPTKTGTAYRCPYGVSGDRLWVRETWASPGKKQVAYAADGRCGAVWDDGEQYYLMDHGYILEAPGYKYGFAKAGRARTFGLAKYGGKWKPSIHMPRWASRITLEVTGVRVERVQEISGPDAIGEGIRRVTKDDQVFKWCVYDKGDYSSTPWQDMPRSPVVAFRNLWDSINAKRGYGWEANPWVWVVEFKKVGQ